MFDFFNSIRDSVSSSIYTVSSYLGTESESIQLQADPSPQDSLPEEPLPPVILEDSSQHLSFYEPIKMTIKHPPPQGIRVVRYPILKLSLKECIDEHLALNFSNEIIKEYFKERNPENKIFASFSQKKTIKILRKHPEKEKITSFRCLKINDDFYELKNKKIMVQYNVDTIKIQKNSNWVVVTDSKKTRILEAFDNELNGEAIPEQWEGILSVRKKNLRNLNDFLNPSDFFNKKKFEQSVFSPKIETILNANLIHSITIEEIYKKHPLKVFEYAFIQATFCKKSYMINVLIPSKDLSHKENPLQIKSHIFINDENSGGYILSQEIRYKKENPDDLQSTDEFFHPTKNIWVKTNELNDYFTLKESQKINSYKQSIATAVEGWITIPATDLVYLSDFLIIHKKKLYTPPPPPRFLEVVDYWSACV